MARVPRRRALGVPQRRARRVGHRLRGYVIDLSSGPIGPVMGLLPGRNLTFRRRAELPVDKMELVGRTERGKMRAFDLCFIDAQHSYEGVKEDYAVFAPLCRGAISMCSRLGVASPATT